MSIKPQICWNNHYFVHFSIRYNEYFDWPISKQYFDDVIYFSVCQLNFAMSITPKYVQITIILCPFLYVTMNILIDQSANSILMTSYILLSVSVELFMSINPKCLNNRYFVYLSIHYNEYFNWPISKQYFDDVIYTSQCVSWIVHVHKLQICLNNNYFVCLSMHYNKFINWPIRKQYFDDVIRIWKYFHSIQRVNKPPVNN